MPCGQPGYIKCMLHTACALCQPYCSPVLGIWRLRGGRHGCMGFQVCQRSCLVLILPAPVRVVEGGDNVVIKTIKNCGCG